MTQRQLAEKYDGPECSNISPFYEWLPLLLLTTRQAQRAALIYSFISPSYMVA